MTTKPDMAHADGCLAVELVAARHMAGAARASQRKRQSLRPRRRRGSWRC